jgi:hypothetical protein
MAITTIRCPVAQRSVVCDVDLEGTITKVFCPELEEHTAICRLKRNELEGGPLSQLIQRASDHTLESCRLTCDLR